LGLDSITKAGRPGLNEYALGGLRTGWYGADWSFHISRDSLNHASSIGDAFAIFNDADTWLELHGVEVVKRSKNLKNPPLGGVAQNQFTNAVWQVSFPETAWERLNWCLLPRSRRQRLKAFKLLKLCKACEVAHGRTRAKRWADRPLDIDILMFHGLTLDRQRLSLPHPGIAERGFVKDPWRELVDGDFEIPGLGPLKDLN